MSDETTARWALPLLQSGQAQKEMVHNEAIAALDLLVQPIAQAIRDDPPSAPTPGQCWIVGAAGVGAWTGKTNHIAGWTAGGWRYVAPRSGMTTWLVDAQLVARFQDDAWAVGDQVAARLLIDDEQVVGPRRPAIGDPVDGSVVDAESRATLAAILAVLRAHGLIAS